MPTLDWIGKKAVVNHHRDVPYRLIHCDKDKSVGDPDAGNLLVQGDNLEALKALLPYYAGKVKCIYIDPPYNTGNEGWVYNDNVSSPEIKAWLGSVVGREAEDLSRHDKWLCMMYPRLRLLKDFLSDDGIIWVSIDDNERSRMEALLDELFHRNNFIASVIWERSDSPRMDAEFLSIRHDYVLCYARDIEQAEIKRIPAKEEEQAHYNKQAEDGRYYYTKPLRAMGGQGDSRIARPNLYYEIIAPDGRSVYPVRSDGSDGAWRWGRAKYESETSRIEWVKGKGGWVPYYRIFADANSGRPPETIWKHQDVGSNRTSKLEITKLFRDDKAFDTPKPERLIARIIEISTDKGDIVLDSFAGSGTTGAVAMKMGRSFIVAEMNGGSANKIGERLDKVCSGDDPGGVTSDAAWQGGSGFRFCTLGEPLFDADGNVSLEVTFSDLAAHVFFCETGSPIPRRAEGSSPFIGTFQDRVIYLLHASSSLGVADERVGNVLTSAMLETLPAPSADFAGTRVVYAEGCTLPDDRLAAAGVTFKQVPYQIEGL